MEKSKQLFTLATLLWCASALAAPTTTDGSASLINAAIYTLITVVIGGAVAYIFKDKFNSIRDLFNERFNALEAKIISSDAVVNERCTARGERNNSLLRRVENLEDEVKTGFSALEPVLRSIAEKGSTMDTGVRNLSEEEMKTLGWSKEKAQ